MLKLSLQGSTPYCYLSEGSGLNPAKAHVSLDAGGGSENATIALYLVATSYRYGDIVVSLTDEEVNLNWELSLNGVDWANAVAPAEMNALVSDQVTLVYARLTVPDDGTLSSLQIATGCRVNIVSTEGTV